MQVTGHGWLLMCTDGLWNYASSPVHMEQLFTHVLQQNPAPPAVAEALVAWANSPGGKDNITVVVARVEGPWDAR